MTATATGAGTTTRTVHSYVDGAFVDAPDGECFDKVSPVDGSVIARVRARLAHQRPDRGDVEASPPLR